MTTGNNGGSVGGGIANLRPWKKGQSGNPGGLSAGHKKVRDCARGYTEEAILTLVDALKDENVTARIAAANAILDRGWGKPGQASDADETEPTVIDATVEQKPRLSYADLSRAMKEAVRDE